MKEEKFLKQIALEEKYGGKTYQQQKAEDEKQKVSSTVHFTSILFSYFDFTRFLQAKKNKAAIGFTYEDSTDPIQPPPPLPPTNNKNSEKDSNIQNETDSDDEDEFDLDTVINFSALSREQIQELNSLGKNYFLGREDFIKYLEAEVEEQESAKNARQEEDEKSAFSGRKSRKERRILKGIHTI